MTDTDRALLVSHSESPAKTKTPKEFISLQQPDKVQGGEEGKAHAVKQPMPSNTNAPTPGGQPDVERGVGLEKGPGDSPLPYSAFVPWRRRFILVVITIAGFFGPLAGGIYLPALPVLEHEFQASATAINITVSVFMLTFAFGVRKTILPKLAQCIIV